MSKINYTMFIILPILKIYSYFFGYLFLLFSQASATKTLTDNGWIQTVILILKYN